MSGSSSPAAQQIVVRKRRRFISVPDDIFERTDISDAARLAAAWMSGRPWDWEFRVWHICKCLGWGDAKWRSVRKELCAAGYFRQRRIHRSDGTFEWVNEFSDVAGDFGDPPDGAPLGSDSITGRLTGGGPIDGERGDKGSKEGERKLTTTTDPASCAESAARDDGGSSGIEEQLLQEILLATRWDHSNRGKPSPSPGSWLFVSKRLRTEGPNPADLAVLGAYRDSLIAGARKAEADLEERERLHAAAAAQEQAVARRESAIRAFDQASSEAQANLLAEFARVEAPVFGAVGVGRNRSTRAARVAIAQFILTHPELLSHLEVETSAGLSAGVQSAALGAGGP